jgi:serine/threonine-protein kinase
MHHVAALGEILLFAVSISEWLLNAAAMWLMYLALEPFVRRRWPGMLVGWNRLLAGDYRDPLVGHDLLIGCASGIAMILLNSSVVSIVSLFGGLQAIPIAIVLSGAAKTLALFSGTRAIVAELFTSINEGILFALLITFFLFLMRVLLRKTWAAIALLTLLAFASPFGSGSVFAAVTVLLGVAVIAFVVFRFGLLALLSFSVGTSILSRFPITTDTSAPYFGIGLAGLALLLAFALYAFRTSLGGRPLLAASHFDD